MRSIHGKRALITGGGTGIGRGIALAWACHGGSTLLVGRRADPLEHTAREIQASGGSAEAWPADITHAADREHLIGGIRARHGAIDVLIHSAGVLAGGAFANHDAATIEQAIDTNLRAPLLLTHAWLPDLRSRHGGIIVVGSLISHVALPGASLYGASKAGLRSWTLALQAELARDDVHVLIAHPPGTRTAMTAPMERSIGGRVRLADPLLVGERIVTAWQRERREIQWGAGDRLLTLLNRLSPALLQRLAIWQARRIERVWSARS